MYSYNTKMDVYLVLHVYSLMLFVSSVQSDHYWRDFNGTIPDDAFKAGQDSDRNFIYIEQRLFTEPSLNHISGTIYEGHVNLTVTAQLKLFNTDDNTKVLCTQHPNNFRWIPITGYSDLSLLTNANFLEGGVEESSVVYLWRALYKNSTEIGKIYHFGLNGFFLNIPNNNKQKSYYKNFEILIYVIDNSDDDIKIDIV